MTARPRPDPAAMLRITVSSQAERIDRLAERLEAAEAEVARLRAALEGMAGRGCLNSVGSRTDVQCGEKRCCPCVARAALKPKP